MCKIATFHIMSCGFIFTVRILFTFATHGSSANLWGYNLRCSPCFLTRKRRLRETLEIRMGFMQFLSRLPELPQLQWSSNESMDHEWLPDSNKKVWAKFHYENTSRPCCFSSRKHRFIDNRWWPLIFLLLCTNTLQKLGGFFWFNCMMRSPIDFRHPMLVPSLVQRIAPWHLLNHIVPRMRVAGWDRKWRSNHKHVTFDRKIIWKTAPQLIEIFSCQEIALTPHVKTMLSRFHLHQCSHILCHSGSAHHRYASKTARTQIQWWRERRSCLGHRVSL